MVLTRSQIDNITKNIIVDYIISKKIVNTSYDNIVKRIPEEYLEDPIIKDELNSSRHKEGSLVDLVMVTACREFIKDIEGNKCRNSINKDCTIDFRKKVESAIEEAGNLIIHTNTVNEDNIVISEQ